MRRCLSLGILFVSVMALWATSAAAGYWITYLGRTYYVGSLVVSSDWWVKNLDVRPAAYAVTISPKSAAVHFGNPGGNLGGEASTNFGNNVELTLTSTVNPVLSGKGKIQDNIVFGDCDNCDPAVVNLPQDGELWLMFTGAKDASGNYCSDNAVYPVLSSADEAGYFNRINCVKSWLTATFEPNTKWVPVSVKLLDFDSVLRAWQDIDNDGALEEVVYALDQNITLNPDGKSYTAQSSCTWQYSYPKSLTDECGNAANQCCDPDWGIYFQL